MHPQIIYESNPGTEHVYIDKNLDSFDAARGYSYTELLSREQMLNLFVLDNDYRCSVTRLQVQHRNGTSISSSHKLYSLLNLYDRDDTESQDFGLRMTTNIHPSVPNKQVMEYTYDITVKMYTFGHNGLPN